MANWFEIYPEFEELKVNLNDNPSVLEIFDKLQRVGILDNSAKIDNYEFDNDCSFINIYNNITGDLVYKFEIE